MENIKKNTKTKNILGLSILALSFILLIPGLLNPMVTLSASIKVLLIKKQVFNETRSILQSIGNLFESKNYLVAVLILFFSVIVPFIKGALLIFAYQTKHIKRKTRVYNFIKNISKWAMADVFVIGIFVAFLASEASEYMNAHIESGFYFFTAYCLLSILSLEFFKSINTKA